MDMEKWKELIKLSAQYQTQDFWNGLIGPESSDLNKKRSFAGLEQEKISTFHHYPRCDMYMDGGRIFVEAEIPGLNRDDIKVSLLNDELVIKGTCISFRNNFQYFLKERPSRIFEKRLTIPLPINKRGIKTSLINGILYIILPIEQDENEKIPILIKNEENS